MTSMLTPRVRSARMRIGSSAWAFRRSTVTKTASRTAPATREVIVSEDPQPPFGSAAWVRP
jgi:hypothetical protein